MDIITGSTTEATVSMDPRNHGFSMRDERGLQVSEGAVELHALRPAYMVNRVWFIECSCGWFGACDSLEWLPVVCAVEQLEARELFDRHRLEVAIARQQGLA